MNYKEEEERQPLAAMPMNRFAIPFLTAGVCIGLAVGFCSTSYAQEQQRQSHPENQPSQGDQPSGSKAPTDGGQSPDTNQESNSKNKNGDSHSPSGGNSTPSGGQSPDTQQEQNSKDGSNKGSKRHGKANARQAHGTPQPHTDSQH